MATEDVKWETKELTWDAWSDMLRDFKCPTCKKTIARRQIDEKRAKLACESCHTYLEPPKKRKSTPQSPDRRTREAAAERSGGSLYPPLPIYYYCENCHQVKLKRIEMKNRYEQEAELQLTLPDGTEGFTNSLINQRLIMPWEKNPSFPFTCACGQRYYLDLKLVQRDRTQHPLFGVKLGYHSECMRCKHAFDAGTTQDHFQFRCDKNINCPHIQKIRERHPERLWVIEEGV